MAEVGDIIRIADRKLVGATDDDIGIWHLRIVSASSTDDVTLMSEIADDLDTNYNLIVSQYPNTLSFVAIDGQNLTQNLLLPSTPWPTLTAGTAIDQSLPRDAAALVWWPTLVPRVQGRKYLGPFVEEAQSSGLWGVANLAALQSFGAAFVGTVTHPNYSWEYGVYNTLLARFVPFSSIRVQNEVRVMRRRRRGRGS